MKSTLLTLFLVLSVCIANGQSGGERCFKHNTAPPANSYHYWPPDTEVHIYFDRTVFTAEERKMLLEAIGAWSEVAGKYGTGVKFTYAGEADGIISCTNCVIVTRRDVYKNTGSYYAYFYPLKLDSNRLLISARVDLDFATKNGAALQAMMAHELGHTMGLADCYTCKKKETIMNAFPGINRNNGLLAPSQCDIEVVKEIYESRRATLSVSEQTLSPKPCQVGKEAPNVGFWMWAPGSTVKVYVLSGDFDSSEVASLLKPVQSWNAVVGATGSRVRFDYAGSTAAPVYCENCLTIMRGPVFDKVKRHATELRAYSARNDQILTWAHIVVDPQLTNPKAITYAVAHELGHTFGLLDCYGCKSRSTVMSQFKFLNQEKDLEGPGSCDIAQVRAAYKEVVVRVRPAPVRTEIADEGEEPEDDDTPVIVRKP